MRVDLLSYDLPPERIAQRPAEERDGARLLVVPADVAAPFAHKTVAEFPDLIPEGALVVVNDTRVIPARLMGVKSETGGRIEIFLVRRLGTQPLEVEDGGRIVQADVWRALGKASKSLRFGTDVHIPSHDGATPRLHVRLLGRSEEDGLLEVALWSPTGEPVQDAIRAAGHVPLPPYIKRDDDQVDRDRYQTVFARVDGAIAAPTAGLHLTRAMIGRLAVRGCALTTVTLHVGLGTFQPVTVEDLDDHPMHTERFTISRTAADAIARARARGVPVVAVGTTVARALESGADPDQPGLVQPMSGETRLLIQPGYHFRVVDMLFTNFHLPRSTLLAMVCAFGGTERVLDAYATAVREEYRFYSYGDAMLLTRGHERA
jgi:S-adenosylmethionine:tRNA ribosyltransferase-isomerase